MRKLMIVSTNDFWEKMCSPCFTRTGLHTGRIGDTDYFTEVYPEKVEGFILEKIKDTFILLNLEPN